MFFSLRRNCPYLQQRTCSKKEILLSSALTTYAHPVGMRGRLRSKTLIAALPKGRRFPPPPLAVRGRERERLPRIREKDASATAAIIQAKSLPYHTTLQNALPVPFLLLFLFFLEAIRDSDDATRCSLLSLSLSFSPQRSRTFLLLPLSSSLFNDDPFLFLPFLSFFPFFTPRYASSFSRGGGEAD